MPENPQPEGPEDPPGSRQDDDKPAAPENDTGEPPSPVAEDPPRPDPDDIDDDDWCRDAQVFNSFHGPVMAPGATFGVAPGTSTRRATGIVDDTQIAAALKCYVEPKRFADAHAILNGRRLVVLADKEGTGKRAGALALLRRVAPEQAKIVSLSPALSLAELASDTRFQSGAGYLVQDWVEDTGTATMQRFEVDRLLRKLAPSGEAGAHLVITTATPGRRRHFEGLLVEWARPDPVELFDACLARAGAPLPEPAEIEAVRRRVHAVGAPGEVVTLVDRLCKARSAKAALAALKDSQSAEVVAWFEEKPKRSEALEVAALAFAHGLPERTFESLLSRLTSIADEIRWGDDRPGSGDDGEDLPQRRAAWSREHPLIIGSDHDPERASLLGVERRLLFRREGHRERVIAEMVARYGYELWEPLRIWVRGLPASTPEVRVQAALGVALLARRSLHEVQESFLEPWSRGPALERLAAAHVLSWMCNDDATAPTALQIALRWVENAGPRPAMTAAVALGAELGVRYPSDCLKWLWFLSLRAEQICEVARRSLILLFRMAVDRGEHATTALRLLLRLVGEEIGERAGSPRSRRALTTVVGILEAERLDFPEPLAASLVLAQPESAELLGGLWGWALRSGPHRAAAIDALRRTLRALDGQDEALDAAARLGAGVWSSLPAEWVGLVERDLRYALVDRPDRSDTPQPRELATVLLAAVETARR